MGECKHPFPKDKSRIRTNFWKEGESKYKWNKAGEIKDYEYTCECGHIQEFSPL